jgi:predicted porin
MKKTLLALAVLGAFAGVASAQNNVTVYGIADAGIQYRNDGNPAGKTWSLESGQLNSNRIGFRGTEDLGGGLSAIFTLENGYNIDIGTLNQSTPTTQRLFGRQAWVGLSSNSFGSVKLGRQQTALYYGLTEIDPFRINLAGNAEKIFGAGQYFADPLLRTDNTVNYATPTIAGFTGSLSYAFGEVPGSISTARSWGAGASYVNSPLNVQIAYQKSNTAPLVTPLATALGVPSTTTAPATADIRTVLVGGTWDFRVAKAHLGYANTRFDTLGGGRSTKDDNWLVGATVPITPIDAVLASWIRNNVKDLPSGKTNQYALGYTHALSRRTSLYTSAAYAKNDSSIGVLAFGPGKNYRAVNFGVRTMF